jgi:hypothetical protein
MAEQPLDDDDYPESWRPRERIARDEAAMPQVERELAAMDPTERISMLRRLGIVR